MAGFARTLLGAKRLTAAKEKDEYDIISALESCRYPRRYVESMMGRGRTCRVIYERHGRVSLKTEKNISPLVFLAYRNFTSMR